MKWFYYLTAEADVVRIKATRKPSIKSIPKSGTWIIFEHGDKGWHIGCFPEATWGTVKDFEYLGQRKI